MQRIVLCFEKHGSACQILNDNVESSLVEEVAHSKSPTYLGYSHRRSCLRADIRKCAVSLVQEDKFWFSVRCTRLRIIDLWVDVTVNHNDVQPSGIVQVKEGIAPANEWSSSPGNSGGVRNIGKA